MMLRSHDGEDAVVQRRGKMVGVYAIRNDKELLDPSTDLQDILASVTVRQNVDR